MTRADIYLLTLIYDAPSHKVKNEILSSLSDEDQELLLGLVTKARAYACGNEHLTIKTVSGASVKSVFDGLLAKGVPEKKYFYQPNILSLNEEMFPVKEKEIEVDASKIWEQFYSDISLLENYTNVKAKAETTLNLLQRYTINLSEPTGMLPTVAYFDYAKNLAGITVALYDYLKAEDKLDASVLLWSEERPFILIGGDISGIQNFIYDIAGRNASKNLKGRSFYLQLLITSILQKLLTELDLFQGNVILDSGGSFFLLAANTNKNKRLLSNEEILGQISQQLFETHLTKISLAVAIVPIEISQMLDGGLNEVMEEVYEQLAIKKLQKFNGKINRKQEELFDPKQVDNGGGYPIDRMTGAEIQPHQQATAWKYDLENGGGKTERVQLHEDKLYGLSLVSNTTMQQINLGDVLRKTTIWVISPKKINDLKKNGKIHEFNPCQLGIYHYLIEDSIRSLTGLGDLTGCSLVVLNQPDFLNALNNQLTDGIGIEQNLIYGNQFYGGNEYPSPPNIERKYLDQPYTFSELAGAEDEEKKELADRKKKIYYVPPATKTEAGRDLGIKRLGVLRMDVDNLGYIFQTGLGKQFSFVQYSNLSRHLDFFFKGYLNQIWKQEGFSPYAQIIYSGGDDLFIVGRWDKMIEFAKKIKTAFGDYVCQNNQISLSGGISIVGHKFPILKGAEMAGKAEKSAKRHELIGIHHKSVELDKNSFTLFDVPLHWSSEGHWQGESFSWEDEFKLVEEIKNQLLQFLYPSSGDRGLSKGFLQKIQTLYEMSLVQKANKQNESWKWIIAYDFAREKAVLKKNKLMAESAFLGQLEKNTLLNSYKESRLKSKHSFLKLLNLAARWAELATRMRSN